MRFLTQPVSDFLQILALLAVAPLAFGQQGTITGMVFDASGASVAHAKVKLSLDHGGPGQETQSADSGDFTFANVSAGPFHISFTAAGFAARTIAGELHAGETLKLPQTVLALATVTTEINVTQTQAEIAESQIKEAETQRLIGLVPNYFVNYNRDAVPLNSKQKFELTWKTLLDPSAFVINGIIAGSWQAQNTYKGFGQGAQGYAKRYGASYADFGTSLVIEKVALTTAFKQDPRYFYKGTGSNRSRFLYAVSRSVICQGDNRKAQFCYSSVINGFASGFITNYYYPAADRNTNAQVVQNAAIGIGIDAFANVFQEFVARRITHKKPNQ
jgi:hypothetical protein